MIRAGIGMRIAGSAGAILVLARLSGACGTVVAQTAVIDPDRLLDCTVPGTDVLPEGGPIGDGSESGSTLVGSGYGAGGGPGLYVTARDTFRVYVNGALVASDSAPRKPLFVPLTLLPGVNALTVVVAAARGTPAALVQLDELSQNYVSDASWKASTAPNGAYTSRSYDDASWAAANDYGAIGSLPGCDPTNIFPAGSTAHWIGPAPESGPVAVLRTVISLVPIGYGAAATGGGDKAPTLVSTWSDLQTAVSDSAGNAVVLLSEGVHDFRTSPRTQPACPSTCTDDATKTEYTVLSEGETCLQALVDRTRNERILAIGSNKTIVGLGRGAAIRGVSFDFGTSRNVVVRNVALFDVNHALMAAGNAFSLAQADEVWIDHATAKWVSQDFVAVGSGARNVTLSWMHYDGVTTDECDGEHTQAVTVDDGIATIHHCFFDHVESHSPTVENADARVHLFNSLLSDNIGYGVGSTCGAQVLMEANTLQRVATPTERATCPDGGVLGAINAPAGSNYYGDDVGPFHGGGSTEPHDVVFVPPYKYTLDVPQDDWVVVLARAGAGGPWAQPLAL